MSTNISNLSNMSFTELKQEAKNLGIEKTGRISKQDLITLITTTLSNK